MSDHDRELELRRVQREAVFWYWRLQDPDLPVGEWHRWRHWHAVPAHREAFESMASVWERLRGRLLTRASASSLQQPRKRLLRVVARAAIVLFILALLGPGLDSKSPSTILQTDADTPAAVMLKDGSIVRVAPDTRLEIEDDVHHRSAYLTQGRAFFDVTQDPTRPFVVRTNLAVATALGTRFGVSQMDKESVVTVMEGTVAVLPARSEKSIKLNTGAQIRVLPAGIQVLWHFDSNQELAWATTIPFTRAPIVEAIEEFNQRSGVRLELADPRAARNVHLSGAFQFDDPESFAQVVADEISAPVLVHKPGSPVLTVNPRTLQPQEPHRNDPAAR